MADRDSAVRVEGVREFRRVVSRTSREVGKDFKVAEKKIAENVAAEARSRAVRGKTGRYAASIKAYAGGVVGSRLPQAGVLHWGGVIRPRGVPITFTRRPVVLEAVEHQADRIVDAYGDAIDQAARRAGWNT